MTEIATRPCLGYIIKGGRSDLASVHFVKVVTERALDPRRLAVRTAEGTNCRVQGRDSILAVGRS